MINVCEVCKIEFESIKPARTCSPKHRKLLSRQGSVTPNVTLEQENVTPEIYFEFFTETKDRVTPAGKVKGERSPLRKAKYWYDVPIAAIPIIKKDWPEMPDFMNGRQYFLWWQNEFKINDKKGYAGYGQPVLHNPFPSVSKEEK